ncbi:MAG: phosphatidylserine decarboxylase [Candidatus Gracilibacteria bacterium]
MEDFIFAFLGLLILSALFYKFWFLRNPKIEIPSGKNILSPAQGKISKITEITPGKIAEIRKGKGRIKVWLDDTIKDYGYMISIVMTPLDVHFQKSPISGIVKMVKHTKGKHRNALSKKLNLETYAENEHQEFIVEGDFKLKIIQIAGMVARRTVSLVHELQQVQKGQDLGLIRFGSQVTLIMPKLELKVKEGDKVRAGQTIIASY